MNLWYISADYACTSCPAEWTQGSAKVTCPGCRSPYVAWINHPLTLKYRTQKENPQCQP